MKARPTTYKGIEMRSRLEAGFAAWLDGWNIPWHYEPQAFASEQGQYLPDFSMYLTIGSEMRHAYLDVKPDNWSPVGYDADALLARMRIVLETEPDAALLVVQPGQVWYGPNGIDRWVAFTWAVDTTNRPSLALPLSRDRCPWPPGYWNGPPPTITTPGTLNGSGPAAEARRILAERGRAATR